MATVTAFDEYGLPITIDTGTLPAPIAHGFGQENAADIVKERCTWMETTEN